MQLVGDDDVPIHLHIAEQTREVDECLAVTGLRPIELLFRDFHPDSRWQLIHATHGTPEEIVSVARSGAGIVICPSTEANLGDGVIDLPAWLAAKVPMTIGSDSPASGAIRGLQDDRRLPAHLPLSRRGAPIVLGKFWGMQPRD